MNRYLLFVNPSFLSGFARVLDLGRTLNEYNYSMTPEVADYYSVKSDWKMVGQDIQFAMAGLQNEIDTHEQEQAE
jgi:hypothetical protein